MLTLAEIRTNIYDMLREDWTDTSAYPPSYVDVKINTAQYNICSGMVVGADWQPLKKLKLPFLFKQAFYQNIGSVGLDVETTVGATELTVTDTTNYPDPTTLPNEIAYLWIANNIISYTGKTPTTFTGVSWVAYPFPSGARVYPLFALPDDYMNTIGVNYNNSVPIEFVDENETYQILNQVKIGYAPYTLAGFVQNWYAQNLRKAFYTIYQGLYFAPFYLDNSIGMFNLTYEKIPTDMVADSDTTVITNDTLALDAISHIAFAEVLMERWEEERSMRHLSFWINATRKLYHFYNRAGSEDQFAKSYRMQKWTWFNF